MSDSGDPKLGEYCVRPQVVFHNITSEYNSTFAFFGALTLILHFSDDICPLTMQNELQRPTSLLHRSLLSYFRLSLGSTPKLSPIIPIPCPLLLLQEFSHGPRSHVCQTPKAFVCVSKPCPSQTPNAFTCMSPNASHVCHGFAMELDSLASFCSLRSHF